jgi:voltage-gated potassium channel
MDALFSDHLRKNMRHRLHEILEAGHANDRASTAFDTVIIFLILANVAAFALETVDDIAAQYGELLELFNLFSVAVFTLEYLARLWACVEIPHLRHLRPWRARARFARRPLLIIDLLAILPFYLSFLFPFDLRVLRVLRLLRFFKLARYSPALQTLGQVVTNERRALFGALIVMMSMLLFASTVIYFLEREAQPENFGNVPQAAWWALATLTTVGYGDVVPVTVAGRMFGGIVMIFGLGMFALPIGIVATGFSQEINRREFVVTWSMVSKVPLFSYLDASAITDLISGLRSQSFPAGSIILRETDSVNAIYFVAAGEIELFEHNKSHLLGPGDFFGDDTLDETESVEIISATAMSNCDLLVLERNEFERLLGANENLRKQIRAAIQRRNSGHKPRRPIKRRRLR